ncbi:DUF2867 domain-containing protein [Cupriavidus basilensis]|uniref:DUF2867 domain-containing protein n=1 Tax=Cupriavidus basilensis TaxID=68895 RepID=A0ABT6AT34_9BURK|nr:DUF2867 domain-containing protein [Cupriavidus basilensis]MDF3835790.1 DUF2867 domain-containing protein [Cupriavidus basilensis]
MRQPVTVIDVPASSLLAPSLASADFFDAYRVAVPDARQSALEIYLGIVSRTPAWVTRLMSLRNRVVVLFGLKDLGHLGDIDAGKPASAYRVGDRVGIFSLLALSEREVVLGDADKHLEVKISVCKLEPPEPAAGGQPAVAVSTVVHNRNALGRVYMLFVAPLHRRIVPATLRTLGAGA